MVDTELNAEDLSRSRSRSLSSLTHSKWREKLREKASRLKGPAQPSLEQQQSDISEFLGSSTTEIEEKSQPPLTQQHSDVTGLVGSLSARSDSKPLNLGLQIPKSEVQTSESFDTVPVQNKKSKKASKGLHVSFSEKEPEIIGEGGDESELPTQQVIGSWAGPRVKVDTHGTADVLTEATASLSLSSGGELLAPSRYQPKLDLQRNPTTRKPIGGWVERRSSMNMEEGLIQAKKADEGALAVEPSSSPPDKHTVTRKVTTISNEHNRSPPAQGNRVAQAFTRASSNPITSPTGQDIHASPLPYPMLKQNSPPTTSVPPGTDTPARQRDINETFLPKFLSQTSPVQTWSSHTNTVQPSNHDQTSTRQFSSNNDCNGQAESDEFYSRVQHLRGVFRLAAEKAVHIENIALENWLRMSSWWFIRGKTVLEENSMSTAQRSTRTIDDQTAKRNHQSYVDLAKAWWTVEDIIPNLVKQHEQKSGPVEVGNRLNMSVQELLGASEHLRTRLKDFATHMQQHHLMPPPSLLIQGADPCIWVEYPSLPPGLLCLTAVLDARTLKKRTKPRIFPLILNDSDRWFCYGHAFATAEILGKNGIEAGQIPCIVSTFRATSQTGLEMIILSQDGQIDLHVQSDSDLGPPWKSIRWQQADCAISLILSADFQLVVSLWENDYKAIADQVHLSLQQSSQWHTMESEQILFDDTVLAFHCVGMDKDTSFASIPVKNSAVRLFRRTETRIDGATQRRFFDGYRIVAKAPTANKYLGCVDRIFGQRACILHSNLRGENEAPALLLAFRDGQTKSSIILTFRNMEQRSYFHAAISGQPVSQGEESSSDIALSSMDIVDLFNETGTNVLSYPLSSTLKWGSLRVTNEAQREGLEHIMFSDHLRICSLSNLGTVVDLANLATGELQVSLDVTETKAIKLYRPAQDNLIVAFADSLFPKEEYPILQTTLQTVKRSPTARRYTFPTLESLHEFQAAATGFNVHYDGFASAFSISHRRNMIPLYKKQEATQTRLQILTYDNRGQRTYQLLCVFSDFPEGKIMNFQLKGTDVFDAISKSGKHCIRIVDAKFALPKHPDNKTMPWDFVCLDVPEYPAEHDDIVISFDTEQDRNAFAKALPAPIKPSRLQALRR